MPAPPSNSRREPGACLDKIGGRLCLQNIHNLNVTSDLASLPGSSRLCEREGSE